MLLFLAECEYRLFSHLSDLFSAAQLCHVLHPAKESSRFTPPRFKIHLTAPLNQMELVTLLHRRAHETKQPLMKSVN